MTTLTHLSVTGMTCGHCVSAVTSELKGVPGVQDVTVELHAGQTSSVRVVSDQPLAEAALRAAIDEAGYDVAELAVQEDALAAEMTEQAPARQAARTPLPMAGSGTSPAGGDQQGAEATAPEGGHGGCACGCGGQGRQGLGIGLPIVPLR
ncbi:copper chaperone [Xylanimonas oleitrophica]|uniref:Copper chaperone n=1 Tax=Xylanimonas oleitrophica TaxID=2607479 RepID=A0A2W5WQW8_9MICO|nr:cation transporter [Xylanimonas oleitrophica]PZR53342.1 copper chaperone [Xylanimonas oleitrophica]